MTRTRSATIFMFTSTITAAIMAATIGRGIEFHGLMSPMVIYPGRLLTFVILTLLVSLPVYGIMGLVAYLHSSYRRHRKTATL